MLKKKKRMKFPEQYRIAGEKDQAGAFLVPFEGRSLNVIASDEFGWDHVSVSLNSRIPNWREMSYVKHIFFEEDEWAFQLHPPKSDHININPYVLHMWRSHYDPIPIPPTIMV